MSVVAVLTDSDYQTTQKFCENLKSQMIKEGSEVQLVTNITLASESALAKDWLSPKEDSAWANL